MSHTDELSHGPVDTGDEIANLAPEAYGGGIIAGAAIKVSDPEYI